MAGGEDIQELMETLSKRKIKINEESEKLWWGYKQSGYVSIKEATFLLSMRMNEEEDPKWKKLWSSRVWLKITLFLWLLLRNKLVTWKNLRGRGLIGPSICVMCCKEEETSKHLLYECETIGVLWEKGKDTFRRIARIKGHPNKTIERWPKKPYKNEMLNRIWELFPGFLLWEAWKERNPRIFEGKSKQNEELFKTIRVHIKETLRNSKQMEGDLEADLEEKVIMNEWDIFSM